MKKRLALLVLLLIPLTITWAADPYFETYAKATGAVTVDSTFDGPNAYWEVVDNIIYDLTDGSTGDDATLVYTISGVAIMDPGSKLWLGIGNDTLKIGSVVFGKRNLDSMCIKHGLSERDRKYVPFSFSALQDTTGNIKDTIYFTAACGGYGFFDPVYLTNVVVKVEIGDDMP